MLSKMLNDHSVPTSPSANRTLPSSGNVIYQNVRHGTAPSMLAAS
jgi:hypothetical protein